MFFIYFCKLINTYIPGIIKEKATRALWGTDGIQGKVLGRDGGKKVKDRRDATILSLKIFKN